MKTVWQFEGYAWSFGGLRWGEQAAPADSEDWIWDAESDFTQTTSWINMLYLGCWICTQAEMWNITIYGFRAKDLLQQFPEEPQVYPYSQSTSAQQLTGTIPPNQEQIIIYTSLFVNGLTAPWGGGQAFVYLRQTSIFMHCSENALGWFKFNFQGLSSPWHVDGD